jgi:predicted amidohydrolase YtcJ
MGIRSLLPSILCSACLLGSPARSETVTLQDIVNATAPLPKATIYVAREVVTLDPNKPEVTAVAVVGDRILATGSLDDLKARAGDQPYVVDDTFAGKVIVPGFIAQHDHPLLSALTMTSEIIAIEDWVLSSGTVPAVDNPREYRARLVEANEKLDDPAELLFTWGYHRLFHGDLTRADLDQISSTRPIIVWHRSVHEFFLNTRALEVAGIDEAFVASMTEAARKQSDLAAGHFWEGGLFAVVPKILPMIATPERMRAGLEFTERYFHENGITLASEPGGIYSKQIQDSINAVLSDPGTPFRYYFIPDGKSIYAMFPDTTVSETENTLSWGRGMTSIMPGQIKLFADGSVYSQLMQLREPYLDGHHGEWIMPPTDFARAFRIYWDAGYQIHVHVSGDAGVDMVLDNLEANMRRNPRYDHRTVLVHFAVSQEDQIDRIRRLGAIVSGNPYYVTMLADKFSDVGLGPKRADNMVRIRDVEEAAISYSYHSDMPMAPAQPLFLMHSAVNRTTVSGRVAGRDQRGSREGALRAVTLDAAYSLQLEKEVGSIVPGKRANFTVLGKNPLKVPATAIRDIEIWGTVHEGRIQPVVKRDASQAAVGPVANDATLEVADLALHSHGGGAAPVGDICAVNRLFASALADVL